MPNHRMVIQGLATPTIRRSKTQSLRVQSPVRSGTTVDLIAVLAGVNRGVCQARGRNAV